jgi:hypothetical protein
MFLLEVCHALLVMAGSDEQYRDKGAGGQGYFLLSALAWHVTGGEARPPLGCGESLFPASPLPLYLFYLTFLPDIT